MNVYFKLTGNDQETEYTTKCDLINNKYVFQDHLDENTVIGLTINAEEIILEKKGSIKMYQRFKKGFFTHGTYHNDLGLYLKINNFTNELLITDEHIIVDYDYYLDDNFMSKMKLLIKIA